MKPRLLVLMLCCAAFSAWAMPQLKIIPLQHRFAEDVLPALQPLVGQNGSIKAFGNQLIVNAEPAEIANVEATLRQLDVELRSWRISVKHDAQGWRQGSRAGVSGRVGNGGVRTRIPDEHGRAPHDLTITAENDSGNWSQGGTMTLNALDGGQAYISVGQQIPFSSYWVTLTQRYAQVERMTEWQDVSTGFMVRPRQIGDTVDIEITPRLSQLNGSGAIEFTALSTHVRARPSEWVDLGSVLNSKDEVSRAILSHGSEQGGGTQALQLMVE